MEVSKNSRFKQMWRLPQSKVLLRQSQIQRDANLSTLSVSPGPILTDKPPVRAAAVNAQDIRNLKRTLMNKLRAIEEELHGFGIGEPNYSTIQRYYQKVYSTVAGPDVKDLTFVWMHLAGSLDDWSKCGLAGDRDTFRWANQPLPRPVVPPYGLDPAGEYGALFERTSAENIVRTLPRRDVIWTPDWYTYPQASINRFDPRAWNQVYFDFMSQFLVPDPSTPDGPGDYQIFQADQTFEVSNTGGPAPNGDGTQTFFFYRATGSGIRMTVPLSMYAMNKMHAVYIGECFKANGGVFPVRGWSQATLRSAFQALYTKLRDFGTDDSNIITQMKDALTLESGYFGLPEDKLDQLLWVPLQQDYPYDRLPPTLNLNAAAPFWVEPTCKSLVAIISFSLGMIPYPVSGAQFPPPNISNAECVASNAFSGLLKADPSPLPVDPTPGQLGISNIATRPYQYYVQTVTNLTVDDNILDPFVNEAMELTGTQACANLAQWNALGGWTGEIPSYVGPIVGGTVPRLSSGSGKTLTSQWWTGAGGVLGINDYLQTNPDFQVPVAFLNIV